MSPHKLVTQDQPIEAWHSVGLVLLIPAMGMESPL